MSKFDHNKIMPRYSIIAFVLTVLAITVVGRLAYIMTVKKDYWMEVADRVKQDSVRAEPIRGNILSCDGELLASSLPEFKIYMDFGLTGDQRYRLAVECQDRQHLSGTARHLPRAQCGTVQGQSRRGAQEQETAPLAYLAQAHQL